MVIKKIIKFLWGMSIDDIESVIRSWFVFIERIILVSFILYAAKVVGLRPRTPLIIPIPKVHIDIENLLVYMYLLSTVLLSFDVSLKVMRFYDKFLNENTLLNALLLIVLFPCFAFLIEMFSFLLVDAVMSGYLPIP